MAKDAAGAEWGRYWKQRSERKRLAKNRKERRPSFYLLYRPASELSPSGDSEFVIKVGITSRNSLVRHAEQKQQGFKLFKSWEVDPDSLFECESKVIKKLSTTFGKPVIGKEAFRVKNLPDAGTMVDEVVQKYRNPTLRRTR